MKVKVIHTDIILYSLVVSITTISLKEIGLQMSKCKPNLGFWQNHLRWNIDKMTQN